MTEDRDALQREAEQAGLANLSDKHLTQFAKAKAAAARLVSAIPRDLPMYVEPAHTFRASQEA